MLMLQINVFFLVEDREVMRMHSIYRREGRGDFPDCCNYGPISLEDPFRWKGAIFGPIGSPYEDGVFFLSIDLPRDYPSKPPKIKFITKVQNFIHYYKFHV